MVALENAWRTGAQQLSQTSREALANDPTNLFAVDQHSNAQKRSGDAATWLPAAKGFRCTYVGHQVTVKAKYRLWVTPAERDAMDPGARPLLRRFSRRSQGTRSDCPPVPEHGSRRQREHAEAQRTPEQPTPSGRGRDVPLEPLEPLHVPQGVVDDDGVDVPGAALLGEHREVPDGFRGVHPGQTGDPRADLRGLERHRCRGLVAEAEPFRSDDDHGLHGDRSAGGRGEQRRRPLALLECPVHVRRPVTVDEQGPPAHPTVCPEWFFVLIENTPVGPTTTWSMSVRPPADRHRVQDRVLRAQCLEFRRHLPLTQRALVPGSGLGAQWVRARETAATGSAPGPRLDREALLHDRVPGFRARSVSFAAPRAVVVVCSPMQRPSQGSTSPRAPHFWGSLISVEVSSRQQV